jgi:hypothetical protein
MKNLGTYPGEDTVNLDPKHCHAFGIKISSPVTHKLSTKLKLMVFLPEEFRSGKMMSDNVLKCHKTARTSYQWIKLQHTA